MSKKNVIKNADADLPYRFRRPDDLCSMAYGGWSLRGELDLQTGRWEGRPFEIDPALTEALTEYVAGRDLNGLVRHEVHVVRPEERLTIVLGPPLPSDT